MTALSGRKTFTALEAHAIIAGPRQLDLIPAFAMLCPSATNVIAFADKSSIGILLNKLALNYHDLPAMAMPRHTGHNSLKVNGPLPIQGNHSGALHI